MTVLVDETLDAAGIVPPDLERVIFATSMVVHYGRPGERQPVCGTRAPGWVLFSVYDTYAPCWYDAVPTCRRCARHVETTVRAGVAAQAPLPPAQLPPSTAPAPSNPGGLHHP